MRPQVKRARTRSTKLIDIQIQNQNRANSEATKVRSLEPLQHSKAKEIFKIIKPNARANSAKSNHEAESLEWYR